MARLSINDVGLRGKPEPKLPAGALPASAVRVGSPDTGVLAGARIAVAHEAPLNPLWPEYGVKFDGSTDDTAAWNAVFNAVPASGGEIYVPAVGTSVVSQITVPINSTDFVVRGGGSRNSGGSCRLMSHYAGSGPVVQANAAAGFKWLGVSIYNDNASFTGQLLDISKGAGSKDTTQFEVGQCRMSAVAQAGSTVRLVRATNATAGEFKGLYGYGGAYGIEGMVTVGDYTNIVTAGEGCYFGSQDLAAIHNLGADCRIVGVTFEPLRSGAAGAYLQDAGVPCLGSLSWLGNFTGDASAFPGTDAWITFNGWGLTVIGHLDQASQGLLLNGEVRQLTLGGYFNPGTGRYAVNFNGQIVRNFRDIGLEGGPLLYTGTSSAYGQGGGISMGTGAVQTQLTSTKAITASTPTALTVDSAIFDTFDTTTAGAQWKVANPTRLTAQAPGLYRVYATVVWQSLAVSGDRAVWFKKNGATWLQGTKGAPDGLTTTTIQNAATSVVLNAGDYVECYVQQTSGTSPINVLVNDPVIGVPTVFGMEKIA